MYDYVGKITISMVKYAITCLLLTGLLFLGHLSAQSVQIYARITGINGPIASVPGLSGSNFFVLGCAEHQMERSGSTSTANHRPLVITKPADPASSPFLRQALSAGTSFSRVELFYLVDSGSGFQPYFNVRVDGAVLTQVTTLVDGNGLQETYQFDYQEIIWIDPVSGLQRGWDVTNNQAL